MVLTLMYCLFLFNRIFFGRLEELFVRFFCDVIRLEYFILLIFVFFVFLFGLFPNVLINFSNLSILKLVM